MKTTILINVYGDSFCDYHENKPLSRAETVGSVASLVPFSPRWQAEQRKAYAKWYHKKYKGGI